MAERSNGNDGSRRRGCLAAALGAALLLVGAVIGWGLANFPFSDDGAAPVTRYEGTVVSNGNNPDYWLCLETEGSRLCGAMHLNPGESVPEEGDRVTAYAVRVEFDSPWVDLYWTRLDPTEDESEQ